MVEEVDQQIRKLVPQLTLPQRLEFDHESLQLLGGRIPLLSKKVGDGVGVHLCWVRVRLLIWERWRWVEGILIGGEENIQSGGIAGSYVCEFQVRVEGGGWS